MNKKLIAKELLAIAKDISKLDFNRQEDRFKDRGWIPVELRKTLLSLVEEKPYLFFVPTNDRREVERLVNWAKKNGSPNSKMIDNNGDYFVKIVDPFCQLLEHHKMIKTKF